MEREGEGNRCGAGRDSREHQAGRTMGGGMELKQRGGREKAEAEQPDRQSPSEHHPGLGTLQNFYAFVLGDPWEPGGTQVTSDFMLMPCLLPGLL